MTIDIISYTEAQYAELPETHILEVQKAQLKKNKLTRKLEKEKQAEKERLLENGTFLSALWAQRCAELEEACAQEVEAIREALLFYLRYTVRLQQSGSYLVDYSLSIEERAALVKSYYDGYGTALERFEAFKADKVATVYLGEAYAALYDYYYLQAKEEV